MSGEIGFNLQEEILRRLPVKSLVRFRSVCKAWRCLIESSYFIDAHTVRQYQCQHLFVICDAAEAKYLSFVYDDTFPQQRFVPTQPVSIKLLQGSKLVGSCNGLVCLDGRYKDPKYPHSFHGRPMVVIWNPSIRKSIAIDVPAPWMDSHLMDRTAFGFGVCPVTNDPKIVMIPQMNPFIARTGKLNDPLEVRIYELSSGKWRSPSGNVPSKSLRVTWCSVVIGKFIYWSGFHMTAGDSTTLKYCTSNLIMSFDMTNDTFEVIDLPDCIAHTIPFGVSLSKLRESLIILESKNEHCGVWMMENGVQKSFTKLFNIDAQFELMTVLGLRKCGTPIMEVKEKRCNRYEKSKIVVYEPNSQHFTNLEIGGIRSISTVNSYMETLLLLGSSDCSKFLK